MQKLKRLTCVPDFDRAGGVVRCKSSTYDLRAIWREIDAFHFCHACADDLALQSERICGQRGMVRAREASW